MKLKQLIAIVEAMRTTVDDNVETNIESITLEAALEQDFHSASFMYRDRSTIQVLYRLQFNAYQPQTRVMMP